ncbi:hypothetical protein HSB1_07450 [Halogranum salarium B-1]|uniref:Uncharacterized protein n=1 Tax=Halogranum salarium B-1 TaxID=1210908 RepID=J3EY16_9EURY|nr:hypothetical protein HSB1_07450 [Halogranum salarium B-1]
MLLSHLLNRLRYTAERCARSCIFLHSDVSDYTEQCIF